MLKRIRIRIRKVNLSNNPLCLLYSSLNGDVFGEYDHDEDFIDSNKCTSFIRDKKLKILI